MVSGRLSLERVTDGDRTRHLLIESQSADACFQLLPDVAEIPYLSRFLCWWLPAVSGFSALSGAKVVSSAF